MFIHLIISNEYPLIIILHWKLIQATQSKQETTLLSRVLFEHLHRITIFILHIIGCSLYSDTQGIIICKRMYRNRKY